MQYNVTAVKCNMNIKTADGLVFFFFEIMQLGQISFTKVLYR